jgi:HTH-type transcriptional regulator/antitoxin HigA
MAMTALHNVLGAYEHLLQQAPILAHIHGDTEYESALEFIETLMEVIGDHPDDPRWGLLEIATKAVDAYEAQTYPEIDERFEQHHGPTSVLRVLMDQHHLALSDFPEIGSQDGVAAVLDGKKDLMVHQVKALSARFKIDPAVFF